MQQDAAGSDRFWILEQLQWVPEAPSMAPKTPGPQIGAPTMENPEAGYLRTVPTKAPLGFRV